MSAEPSVARLRRLAQARGLELTKLPDGRLALHRGDPDRWDARGAPAFIEQVLNPQAPDGRPGWSRGRR